jgi:hypothetical protein
LLKRYDQYEPLEQRAAVRVIAALVGGQPSIYLQNDRALPGTQLQTCWLILLRLALATMIGIFAT